MTVKQASTEYDNISRALIRYTKETRLRSNVVMAMAVEEGQKKINGGPTRSPLTEDDKIFNYAMSGAGLLLLLIIIVLAKGLYEWKYRRRRTNPVVPPTTRVTEAWSAGNKNKTTTGNILDNTTNKGKQSANKTNFNGSLDSTNISPTTSNTYHP